MVVNSDPPPPQEPPPTRTVREGDRPRRRPRVRRNVPPEPTRYVDVVNNGPGLWGGIVNWWRSVVEWIRRDPEPDFDEEVRQMFSEAGETHTEIPTPPIPMATGGVVGAQWQEHVRLNATTEAVTESFVRGANGERINIEEIGRRNMDGEVGSEEWRREFYTRLCSSMVAQWATGLESSYVFVEEIDVQSYEHVNDRLGYNVLKLSPSGGTIPLRDLGTRGIVFLRPDTPDRSDDTYGEGIMIQVTMRSTFPDAKVNRKYVCAKIVHKVAIEQLHFGDNLEEYLHHMLREEMLTPFWDQIKHHVPLDVNNSRAASLLSYKRRRRKRQAENGNTKS